MVYSPIVSFGAALSYGVVSLSMGFINKGILMQYPFANSLLLLQMAATLVLINVAGTLSVIHVRPIDLALAWRLAPLAFFYNGNVAFSLASLQGLNIPMYIALKRLTPMAVLIAGVFTRKSRPKQQVVLSVIVTVSGCVIAAWGDLDFDIKGYSFALVSVILQTGYLVMVERGGEEGLRSSELMMYNALLSLPVLSIIVWLTGEGHESFSILLDKQRMSVSLFAAILVSLFMGVVLNFTMFLCTITNSALTTTIVGVLKGVGSTTLGFFILGGVKVHLVNVMGLVINTCGGVWYSIVKYREKNHNKGAGVR